MQGRELTSHPLLSKNSLMAQQMQPPETTEPPDIFSTSPKDTAGPGPQQSCLPGIASCRGPCFPGLVRVMPLEETTQDKVSPGKLSETVSFPHVTYVCGGGAGQGHRLNRCRESECGLCLFIFRGVRMTGWGGCWGKGSKPQHCIVFWRTTYMPREGNKRGKGGVGKRGGK